MEKKEAYSHFGSKPGRLLLRDWSFFKGQTLELHEKESVEHDTLFCQQYSCKDPPLVSSADKQCSLQLQILCAGITGLHFLYP